MPTPTAVEMDRNGPEFERWEPERTVWWPQDPTAFVETDAEQGCTDVLNRWHAAHPEQAATSDVCAPTGRVRAR